MGRILLEKMKEALISVLPVTAIVLILNFTPLVTFSTTEILVFSVSSLCLIFGMGLFNLGADVAMTPMGEKVGFGLVKKGSLALLLGVVLVMGILITVAEPDLTVLAEQVSSLIDGTALIVTVGVGVGLFLVISVLKIVYKKELSSLLLFFYLLLFALSALLVINGKSNFLAMSFDSGGVTTGPITVPFIMALGVGLASAVGGRSSRENSFGLVALCSIGPILAVAALGLFSQGTATAPEGSYEMNLASVLHTVLDVCGEVGIALGMMVVFYLLLHFFIFKGTLKALKPIAIGILFTYAGLVIFLSSVSVGFMPIGHKLGGELAKADSYVLPIAGLVLGMVVVLAEPAVHVLNRQVEEITDGTVSKKSMMIALSLGVGLSLCLSMIRIVFQFSILYYLVPGYILSLGLSFFVPKIYTAIAFDSGGVASGPLTSSFILPLAIGACSVLGGDVMSDAFGVVAMVAMTPLITIQLLGFKAVVTQKMREKIAMDRIKAADDEQIIEFM